MTWPEAVIEALRRFSNRNKTRKITRQQLIDQEMDRIVEDTESQGATPTQTLSRILQELRDDNILYFDSNGVYILLDVPINIEEEEFSEDIIDFAIKQEKLQIGIVPTDDRISRTRQRIGQERIRELTLQSYDYQCALCDVTDPRFLIASHISRWGDDLESRGHLSNVMCLCKFHDALFEGGYFTLANDYKLLKKSKVESQIIKQILDSTVEFRLPKGNPPDSKHLRKHRIRTGFEV